MFRWRGDDIATLGSSVDTRDDVLTIANLDAIGKAKIPMIAPATGPTMGRLRKRSVSGFPFFDRYIAPGFQVAIDDDRVFVGSDRHV